MFRKTLFTIIFLLLVFTAPLAGIWATGRSLSQFTSFPPLTEPALHQPFSWPVFLFLSLISLGVLGLLVFTGQCRTATTSSRRNDKECTFPWWGWAGLMLMALSWALAWTRLPWFSPFQRHTFIPLWLSYIIVINGLCQLRSGSSPMTGKPLFFAALFPLSSAFWWLFEYLNQFVDNWYYTGVDYGPLTYSIHASISFSTVLPAVYSTRELILQHDWFKNRFSGLPSFTLRVPLAEKMLPLTLLVLSWTGLAVVPVFPEESYPLLWISPLLLLTAILHLFGKRTLFSSLIEGDWRPAVSAALAAMVCGFFWETWNYYSLAKWIYVIPYVHRFEIFEMPLLGYMGYLPFGLLCVEVVEFFSKEK